MVLISNLVQAKAGSAQYQGLVFTQHMACYQNKFGSFIYYPGGIDLYMQWNYDAPINFWFVT